MCCEDIVTFTDVEKKYGKSRALGPVTLNVGRGEILGVRGPNGAGKSTLLTLMAGIIRPDAGRIWRSDGAREATSLVPQELSLYETLTSLENLKFWGLASGLPSKAASARAGWLLEGLGLTEKARARVSELSGGMKRRLHLASALMTTPELLLLDEPTVGADRESAEAILKMLRHFNDMGTTIVLISHRQGELESVCGRIIDLREGKLAGEAVR